MTMRVYAEEEVLHPIYTVFSDLHPVKQYITGLYRIDLYFPTQKVAVECDEAGHREYDKRQEANREEWLTAELHCRFVRFDPYENGFCIFKLINRLLLLLCL